MIRYKLKLPSSAISRETIKGKQNSTAYLRRGKVKRERCPSLSAEEEEEVIERVRHWDFIRLQ